ncbi:MAG: DUF1266 domain-containing protein [Butyribacter sp.]|nr:DUF1266 domain-containing protein [bacterium]MDY3853540.1 DUF1266 domain-containing protein [Butyribacter sp.]
MIQQNHKSCIKRWTAHFMVLAITVCLFSGCTAKKEEKKETVTPKPTYEKVNQEEETASNLGLWTRAMGSVLIYINDGNPYYFGGYQTTEDNKEAAVRILSQSWNINSRKDLLKQIKILLVQGDRKEYVKEAKEMKSMSKKKLKTAMKQLSGDILIHYETVQYNWKKWKKKGLLAWDMCRISHLVQWGYVAGYLTVREAQALIEPAAKRLQKNFKSWEEVQNNWLDGYCLYADVDRTADGNEYVNRKTVYEKLRDNQTKKNLLYDDKLFTDEIIPLSDISYQTILEEIKK